MSFIDESAHFTRAELISEGQLYPEFTEKGIYVNDYYFGLMDSYYGTTILDDNNFNNSTTNHKGYWGMDNIQPVLLIFAFSIRNPGCQIIKFNCSMGFIFIKSS